MDTQQTSERPGHFSIPASTWQILVADAAVGKLSTIRDTVDGLDIVVVFGIGKMAAEIEKVIK